MILPRYRVEYEMYLTSHSRGDLVELKDVMKMLESFKTDGYESDDDFERGANAVLDLILNELKKETI